MEYCFASHATLVAHARTRSCSSFRSAIRIWDEWTDKKTCERIKSCTIITCPPNAVIGALHDRMPVILAGKDWPKWLGEQAATPDELKALLTPIEDAALKLWPVNQQKVGNVRNKDREVGLPEVVI